MVLLKSPSTIVDSIVIKFVEHHEICPQVHEDEMRTTADGMQDAADRVKLLVQQQMNDLRKAIDAKEQVCLQRQAFVPLIGTENAVRVVINRHSWMICKTTERNVHRKCNGSCSIIANGRVCHCAPL